MKLWLKNHLWKVPILLGLFWILNEIRIEYRFGLFLAQEEKKIPGITEVVDFFNRSNLERLISDTILISFVVLALLNLVLFRNKKALISILLAGIMFLFLMNGGIFSKDYFLN